ncbi:hypothetical protein RJ639_028686 [Escallonia herrerae]|uniref:Reverse transcriptase Ty1/copia-type domain-containing protein n=1 Tax=Escallonia herrerae TaxID=1293975 RepID=A0AA88X5S6_9ASTE|nr:hypothetical protein RJ639_028686 [Escallonia herrerae]
MAKDAETSKPKHLDPTLEYYLSSQANSELSSRGSPAMSQNAIGSSSGPLQAFATAIQNNNPSLSQAQAAATFALPGLTFETALRRARLDWSPRNWFAKLSAALRSYGFLQSHADHTLFTYRKGDVFLSVLVYVDDLILAGNNSTACSSFKKYLNDCFKLKDLGPLKYFLGIEAARGPRGLFLSEPKYELDILSESGLSASKPAAFPMEHNHGLALAGGPLLSDPGPYRRSIGRLVYLTITRPDICYAVHVLSQFMQSLRSQHWDATLRVLRYLKAAPGQGLFLPADSPLQIYAFCDSDWASCPLTRRFVTGYFVSLGNSPISMVE